MVNENIAQSSSLIKDELEKGSRYGAVKKQVRLFPVFLPPMRTKTEYLDYILSIKVVENIDEAIEHINTYGSGHTDVIISENKDNIDTFLTYVDSGNVFVNCSTRFSDGFRYGFGAEVGISTNKIHARGPVGLEGLVTYKYKVIGNGHLVADYAENRKTFKHRPL